MVFIFFVLFITAIILWISNRKDEATKWAVFFMLCGSSGSLGVTIEQSILPALQQYQIGHAVLYAVLYRIQIYSSFFNQICFPYAVLMYAIVESGWVKGRIKSIFGYALTVPVWIMILATPTIEHKIRIDYKLILIWVVPYLLLTCILLVSAYWKETNRIRKKHRLRTVVMIVPTVAAILAFNYIAKAMQLGIPIYRYLAVFVGFSFVMFFLFAFVHEALGVRLRFERQRLDTAMRAMTSGASFVNHAIKNQMSKIRMLAERTQTLAAAHNQQEIQQYVSAIQDAAKHLLDMSTRLHSQLRDLELKEVVYDVESLIERCLTLMTPLLKKQNIRVVWEEGQPFYLQCDCILLQEVLMNICINAIEAMPDGGELSFSVCQTKKWLVIEIKDNGLGIRKENRSRLMEPFFSTKLHKGNMGLGLSFCYNVMQKHDGMIEIASEESVGTTVSLYFPSKRIIKPAQRSITSEKKSTLVENVSNLQ